MLQYSKRLDVWQLGGADINNVKLEPYDKVVDMNLEPKKLIEIRSKKSAMILCSAIASNASIVAFADSNSTTIISLVSWNITDNIIDNNLFRQSKLVLRN
jgi:hypothetical protein